MKKLIPFFMLFFGLATIFVNAGEERAFEGSSETREELEQFEGKNDRDTLETPEWTETGDEEAEATDYIGDDEN